jgi:hypothetical protein
MCGGGLRDGRSEGMGYSDRVVVTVRLKRRGARLEGVGVWD